MGVGGGGTGLGVMLCWFLLPLTNISRICSGDAGWERMGTEISTPDAAPRHPDTKQPQAFGLRHPAALQAL